MSDLVILKCKTAIKPKDYETAYFSFLDQKAYGLMMIPSTYDVVVVPEDVDIQLETPDKTYLCPVAKEDRDKVALCYKWIPCSERLPEENGIYMITDKRIGEPVKSRFDIDHKWGITSEENVIAWMPLPEVYKGE